MSKLADRLLLAAVVSVLPPAAYAATQHLGAYLKTYYSDFAIVKECVGRHQLSAGDVDNAKAAIAKIEAYYLQRDPAIKKDVLSKQAVSDKNIAFKMMMETGKVDLRQFCHASLNDIMSKLHDIEAAAPASKGGSSTAK
jgi:hypothetical protein